MDHLSSLNINMMSSKLASTFGNSKKINHN
jgi:hypothetical protein